MRREPPHWVLQPKRRANPERVYAHSLSAEQAVEGFGPGERLLIWSRGQFSLFQLVRALLRITGPAAVSITSWSVGPKDIESVAALLEGREIEAYRMLCSQRWLSLKPESVGRMVALFGDTAVTVADCHAKVATIRNERWNIAVRGSANMNENPRYEQFDVDDDEEIADFYDDAITEIQELGIGSFEFGSEEKREAFERALHAESDRDALIEMLGEDVVKRRERALAKERASRLVRGRLFGAGGEGGEAAVVGQGAAPRPARSGLADMTPEEAAEWRLAAAELAVEAAGPGSIAYNQALKAVGEVHAELHALRQQRTPEETPADVPWEEWRHRVVADAQESADQELEIYVSEWVRRQGYVLVSESGELVLRRRAVG